MSVLFECVLESLHLHIAAAANDVADGALHIVDGDIMAEGRFHHRHTDFMQVLLNRINLYTVRFQCGRVVSGSDGDGILRRFSVSLSGPPLGSF